MDDQSNNEYLALPESGRGPGVLVLHAWWGLNAIFRDFCDRLAREGFVVLAPDLYGGKVATTIEEAEQLSQALDHHATYATVSAALERLRAHPAVDGGRIGVVGFSMGAAWALMLEQRVAAVVLFYGTVPPEYVSVDTAFQGHFAEDDPYEEPAAVRQLEDSLRAKGREVTFYFYPGTQHWFFEENRPEYRAQAASLAWERTLEFLRGHLSAG